MTEEHGNQPTEQELRSRIITDMAHELRTPLGGILGINELLMASPLDPEQKDYAETVHHSAKSMLHLLTDIVELSRLDGANVTLEPSSFNLESIFEECAFMLRKHLALHSIELKTSIDPNVPSLLTGDTNRLRQIFTSLILGATKFIESGSLSLQAKRDDSSEQIESVIFTIQLPPNTVNRNGEPMFTQLANENAPVQRYDSTWLRLRIAHILLKLMSASIKVSGNTLQFTIKFANEAG